MFVRIIRGEPASEMTFECNRCFIKPVEGSFDKIEVELISVECGVGGPYGNVLLDCSFECKDLEIFLMNDQGKTIDRKVW